MHYVRFTVGVAAMEPGEPLAIGDRVWFQADRVPRAVVATLADYAESGRELCVGMEVSAEDAQMLEDEWLDETGAIPEGRIFFERIQPPTPLPPSPSIKATRRPEQPRRWWKRAKS